ncbi:GNAT family N-acetyltransferase [Mycobacterium alsense]|uniref:GNAT family N-acetyltransferase n=1 Tax=Mycobacterium alsense TaxID=324058 RepID=A0AA41XQ03_9MYCO|nr:GNAT family N-acetyltransferase [Mycobacterium alsense]MCV7380045.1 GNAT family N-acetyltransferase [Mycobacterium alsense]OQZ91256.1 GNAT family N-acetyltransferase [Mycobacterium alsense]
MVDHRHVEWDAGARRITTPRLVLRPWRPDDELAAYAIYGAPEVARWLCPALPPIADRTEMRRVLEAWTAESDPTGLPLGRWAITDKSSEELIGGVALLPLPPGGTDLEIGWQLSPNAWGHGYGAEAGHAVAHQAFENPGVSEVFAVVRPENRRGVATARRVGMEWVGETDKYYNLTLQVYRLTKADLDLPEPACAQ